MAAAARLRLRLFLEGVEVPIVSAVVQAMPNAPAAASIQIPPLAEGTRFLPRTLVHLFFFDARDAGGAATRALRTAGARDLSPSAHEQALPDLPSAETEAQDASRLPYKLLFAGEIVGFTYTKNASNRSLVLQCVDFSNYWDYAFQWQNTDLFGPGIKALFSGGSTNLFTDFLTDEGSIIARIIQTPSVQYPRLKGLLGGLIHLLEAIGGSYYTSTRFAGQNIFFSLAELRLHIAQMITAYEDDPTAARLLNADGYDSLFGRTIGGLGSQVSIRQALNALMGVIFHETFPIPCPLYVPGTGNAISGQTRRRLTQDPKHAFIAERAQALVTSLSDLKSTVQDSLAAGFSGPGDAASTLPVTLELARKQCASTASLIRDPAVQRTRAFFVSAQKALDQARTKVRALRGALTSQTFGPIAGLLDGAIADLRRVAEYEIASNTKNAVPARLNAQIFRPDIWFGSPPKCNVLFPEQYTSFTYARSFLQETTRFLLKTNSEFFGEDELFDQFYFAPRGPSLKRDNASLANILSNDLLDHELFTGILPAFEKLGELNIFAARSGTVAEKMPKIGLAQRSANFLYFKYRFASRRFEVSARFCPQLAPGFPGLIVDKYMDADSLKRRRELMAQFGPTNPDANRIAGTHFLANFTEISHSVDQSQGRTEIRGSYARQADESVEFLGIDRSQTVQRRAPQDAVRSTDIAALSPPRSLSMGPNGGTILRASDITDSYRATDLDTGQKLPVFGPKRPGNSEQHVRVPVGIQAPASAYGPDVVSLVGDPVAVVMFRAYRVEERVPRYERDTVDLPAEEYIRPGWYGDVWHPAQIGKAYQQFFQTGAITDAVTVSDPSSAPSDDPNAPFTLANGASIQTAVGFLVELYSHIRTQGLDVEDFIGSYTWRPIANMVDLFGTSDLRFSPDGHQALQGVEGFHSRAFGPYDDLFGLVLPDIDTVVGIRRGSTVAQKGDTRKRKQAAVQDYLTALQFARAVLG